jgi:tetratricopeptide (TPR) repeat protein
LLDGPNDRHLWSEDYQRELGGILSLQREIAQAIAQQVRAKVTPQQQSLLKPALAVNPEAYDAYLQGRFYMSTKFSQPKELKKAKGYFEDSIRKDPNFALSYVGGLPEYGDQDATAALAHAYAMTGKRAEAEKILRDLERKSKTSHVSPYMIATVYAGLGDKDKAFEFLEKAYQERCWDIVWCFKADPRVDNLRSDPASRLCKKM